MNSEEVKEELKLLAKEEGVTVQQLKEIIYLTFKFIRQIIKSANKELLYFPSIRLMNVGIFHVTKARQNKFKEKYESDENNNKE